ncbi:MAG: glycosyltransferase [Puniceicoccaceae bacterium]|nr:MAG: glycosyltransferase [Puniceicoccaceae bacterium]
MKITAVVVTYNRLEKLKKVIESIRSQTASLLQILVVNNGSTDGSREWLESQNDIYLINQGNLGGAGGFNTGMKQAVLNGTDYVWIMDDDVYPEESALSELVNQLDGRPKLGFACSSVVDPEGNCVNTPDILNHQNVLNYKYWQKNLADGVVYLEACTFVSVLFSVDIIKKVGLPIKDYFIWGDDTEYTYRIALEYKSPGIIVGKSQVIHDGSYSGAPSIVTEKDISRIKMQFYMIRNRIHYIKLYYKGNWLKKCIILFVVDILMILMRSDMKFRRLIVLFKGFFFGLIFNPKIEGNIC